MDAILKYEWKHELIEFEMINGRLMVNATQMAKAFGKKVENFTRTEPTRDFIDALLNNALKRFLDISEEDEIIISKQKSGTWMHRILALKFAAWLDPDFEVWVYTTIDQILFDHYKKMEESLKRSAWRRNQIAKLRDKLAEIPEYLELRALEITEQQEVLTRRKENQNQLELFRNSEDTSCDRMPGEQLGRD